MDNFQDKVTRRNANSGSKSESVYNNQIAEMGYYKSFTVKQWVVRLLSPRFFFGLNYGQAEI